MAQKRREKAARDQRDITQLDVAKAGGVSKGAVSRYESDVDKPRDAILERIAVFLGTTPAYLRYGVEAGGERQAMPLDLPQPDPTRDRLLTEDDIERARRAVVRKGAKKSDGHRKRRGA